MTQYLLQIENDTQRLIKSYEITEDSPIRPLEKAHKYNRKQIIITDTDLYNEIVNLYNIHKGNVKFNVDEDKEIAIDKDKINWIIE